MGFVQQSHQRGPKTVTKTILNDVYELLNSIGAVRSEGEFSTEWLGRSECYLRTLRFKGSDASVGAVAICASKLQHYGKRMLNTEQHSELGKQFLQLSEQCHKLINIKSTAEWLNVC
ncbi:DUF6626 family protein [Thalassobacter stenotrophicus]